jgi:hypothetical protein
VRWTVGSRRQTAQEQRRTENLLELLLIEMVDREIAGGEGHNHEQEIT